MPVNADVSLGMVCLYAVIASNQIKQEYVRPRWPYDMRPSARAEKYMCVIVFARWRDVTLGNDNGTDGQTDGQTDRQTDIQSATQYAAPS